MQDYNLKSRFVIFLSLYLTKITHHMKRCLIALLGNLLIAAKPKILCAFVKRSANLNSFYEMVTAWLGRLKWHSSKGRLRCHAITQARRNFKA